MTVRLWHLSGVTPSFSDLTSIAGTDTACSSSGSSGSLSGAAGPAVLSATITEVRQQVARARDRGQLPVGLVPTMGYFHEGHLSLMRKARQECGFVVVSIFVNPIQFDPAEDLKAYPNDFDRDLRLAADEGVDLIFHPADEEMYPEGFETHVEPGSISEGLCGQARPGHFRGVATIVAKLFNIVGPDRAYFGQKDAQQAAVIRRMADDLDFGIDIRVCPTVREPDGLAMSSRNSYLTAEERAQAPILYQALTAAREALAAGEANASKIRRIVKRTIGQNFLVELEYVRIVDPVNMEPMAEIDREALVAVAVRIGRARLIDNLLISPEG